MGWKYRGVVGLVVVGSLLSAAGVAHAAPPVGYLTPFAEGSACFGYADGCMRPVGAGGYTDAAVSPDNRNLYVVAWGSEHKGFTGVLQFARAQDGMMSQLPSPHDCATANPFPCGTPNVRGLEDANSIALSPDGLNAYVTATGSQAVVAFGRGGPLGALEPLGAPNDCVAHQAASTECGRRHPGLAQPGGIAVSTDGRHVYVADQGVDILARDRTTGGLTALASPAPGPGAQFARSIVISPDGKSVYTASLGGAALAAYARNADTGALTQLAGPQGCVELVPQGCNPGSAGGPFNAQALAISPDGRHLYAVVDGLRVVAFARDTGTGAVTALAPPHDCVTAQASGCGRTAVRAIPAPTAVSVSPDGLSVYVVSAQSEGGTLGAFSREATTGGLTPLPDSFDCLTGSATGCGANSVRGLFQPHALASSPNGDSVYAVTWPNDGPGSIVMFGRNVPACEDRQVTTGAGQPASIALACADPGGVKPTIMVTEPPAHGSVGTINQADSTIVYHPAQGYAGPDSFVIQARDLNFASAPARVTIEVAAPPSAPPPSDAGTLADDPSTEPLMPRAVSGPHLPTPGVIRARRPRVTMVGGNPLIDTGVVIECPHESERCFAGAGLSARSRARTRARASLVLVGRRGVTIPSGDKRPIVIRSQRRARGVWRRRGCTRMVLEVSASAAGGNFWQRVLTLKLRHPAAVGRARCPRKKSSARREPAAGPRTAKAGQ